MLGVMLLVFLLFNTFAGDPAQVLAGKISNKAEIENIRKQLGVDEPHCKQMTTPPKKAVTGDLRHAHRPQPHHHDPDSRHRDDPMRGAGDGGGLLARWIDRSSGDDYLHHRDVY